MTTNQRLAAYCLFAVLLVGCTRREPPGLTEEQIKERIAVCEAYGQVGVVRLNPHTSRAIVVGVNCSVRAEQ
jgi:hypothetical protein